MYNNILHMRWKFVFLLQCLTERRKQIHSYCKANFIHFLSLTLEI